MFYISCWWHRKSYHLTIRSYIKQINAFKYIFMQYKLSHSHWPNKTTVASMERKIAPVILGGNKSPFESEMTHTTQQISNFPVDIKKFVISKLSCLTCCIATLFQYWRGKLNKALRDIQTYISFFLKHYLSEKSKSYASHPLTHIKLHYKQSTCSSFPIPPCQHDVAISSSQSSLWTCHCSNSNSSIPLTKTFYYRLEIVPCLPLTSSDDIEQRTGHIQNNMSFKLSTAQRYEMPSLGHRCVTVHVLG